MKNNVSYNYHYVDSVIEVNGICYIKKSSVLSRYIYVHCGVEILSMSKRIMNNVFSCADDCGVKIYDQDTDSRMLIKLLRYITNIWITVSR